MRHEPTPDRATKPVGLAVAGALVVFFSALPAVTIVFSYVFLSVYAIVRAIDSGTGYNPVTIVVGFVLVVSMFVALLAVGVHFVGRSLTPRRRPSA